MCGLVFAGGKVSLTSGDVELFEQMGISDTLRGAHSTGVCAVYKPYNGDWFTKVLKSADDGYDFFRSKEWGEIASHPMQSAVQTTYVTKVIPKALFGHNRYATQGAINAVNAHPFTHGHITLAHNGTLTNWKSLVGAEQFTVDSEAIAYSVSQVGFEETLKKLQGAYTLIWLDTEQKTLNIFRNTQRPFFLAQTPVGDWFGASEEGLVRWILGRGKSPRKIEKGFECEPGVQYIFDVSTGCVLKEERKHELPVFRQVQTQAWSGGFYSSGSYARRQDTEEDYYDHWAYGKKKDTPGKETSVTPHPTLEDRIAAIGLKAGLGSLKMGDEIRFDMVQQHIYPGRPEKCRIVGWLPDAIDYVEVHVHNIYSEHFNDDAPGYGKLVSAYMDPTTNTATLILNSKRGDLQRTEFPAGQDDQDFSFLENLDDEITATRATITGERFSEAEWDKSHHNVCSMCSNPIPFDEVEVATIENGYCFCGDCIEATELRKKDTQAARIEAAVEVYCHSCGTHHKTHITEGNMTQAEWNSLAVSCQWKIFYKNKFTGQRPILSVVKPKAEEERLCVACDTKVPVSMMSESADLCKVCSDRFQAAQTDDGVERKTTAIGMKVTREQWYKINRCNDCGSSISWFFADKVKFVGTNPVCHSCKA